MSFVPCDCGLTGGCHLCNAAIAPPFYEANYQLTMYSSAERQILDKLDEILCLLKARQDP